MSLSLIGFGVNYITSRIELSLLRFPERVRQGGRAVNTNIRHSGNKIWRPKNYRAISAADPGHEKTPQLLAEGLLLLLGFDLLLLIPATY